MKLSKDGGDILIKMVISQQKQYRPGGSDLYSPTDYNEQYEKLTNLLQKLEDLRK